jgi:hypothetical protein
MSATNQQSQIIVQQQDVVRWLTFSGFWGFVFYLLAYAGIAGSQRRQPVAIHRQSALVSLGIHLGVFVGGGSLFSALSSLVRRQSTTALSHERIEQGTYESSVPLQALSGGIGSLLPFAVTVGSMRAAEQITGKPVFADADGIDWTRAAGTTALLSGLTALAVSRIAGWIVSDARAVFTRRQSV